MVQEISFEYDDDESEFHLLLDGEDQGVVDKESLEKVAGRLYMHFYMFRDQNEEPETDVEKAPQGDLSEEELNAELEQEMEAILDDLDEEE